MSVAFLVTSPYQIFHYKWIAPHLDDVTVLLEIRDRDFGLSEELVRAHIPSCDIRWVARSKLKELDGKYEAIVCQTPILPLEFLRKSRVIAQQYSMAKERYQYGVWRTHADLNLMYGQYSLEKVQGFANAVAVGNPLLDPLYWEDLRRESVSRPSHRRSIAYMPTYGQLSSFGSVLPVLARLDADVTVKVHHAEESEVVKDVDDRIRVVRSDTDPVAFLRNHDAVVTDFSGAAFDALHAGLPVVVAGAVPGHGSDAERLSPAELRHETLGGLVRVWDGEGDLLETLAEAAELVGTDSHKDFCERTLTGPGSAGKACAAAIARVVGGHVPENFAVDQVRETTRRYVMLNRELQAKIQRHRSPQETAGFRGQNGSVGLLLRRARRKLARSVRLRNAVRHVRSLRRRLGHDKSPTPSTIATVPMAPAERREEMFRLLEPRLLELGVSVARAHAGTGADVAVLTSHKRLFHKALHEAGTARPGLTVRVGIDWRIVETLPAQKVRHSDVTGAHWVEVGTAIEASPYKIGTMGYLTVLFVEEDRERKRLLAQRLRASRTDWTGLLEGGASSTVGRVVVGTKIAHVAEPVDVVYTWVDSNDPVWCDERRRYGLNYEAHNPSANNEERYADRDELRYSLRSLMLFAPFVRNIYIVTAGHYPQWLEKGDSRVRVVSHSEIFPDSSVLPTFNSHAIESCLHRIDGLSEHFLYFNDDVLLGREVHPDDFFTKAGLAKVRFSPSQFIYSGRPQPDAIPTDWAAYNAVRLIAEDFGLNFDRRVQHVPMPLRRTVLEEIEERYSSAIDHTRRARFRSPTDLAVPSMFAHFFGVATARAVEWPPSRNEYVYLDTGRADASERYDQILRVQPKFFCLNATRYDDIPLSQQVTRVRSFLSSAFPEPAPWEIT